MELGTELRKARERAGFSLPDLAARTRIPLKSLRAIEEHDFASVPPGIFVRSFIRSYAREVGVDPADAIAEYRAMTEPVAVSAPDHKDNAVVDDDLRGSSFDPELLTSRPAWGYALIAAALLIGVISMNRYGASENPQPAAADALVTDSVAPVSRPMGTAGTGVHLEMRAQGPCWIKAVADGQTVIARVLQPGETQSVTGQRDIVVRVGDPAAISYSINGRPGEPLGVARVPVTVRFGADGRTSPAS